MGRSGIFFAETQAEKEAVYRFRYRIYVTEMGRYASVADHERKMVFEPEDATARILSLSEGTLREVIAREPSVAGKLLLNVCKILAMRLTTG